MSELILLVGNIGTGKSFYRESEFSNEEIIICPDEWKHLSTDQNQAKMISDVENGLFRGKTVILDGNNMTKKSRHFFDGFIRKTNSTKTIIDFGEGDEESLKRRIENSKEQTPEFWTEKHVFKRKIYEQPTQDECDVLIKIG